MRRQDIKGGVPLALNVAAWLAVIVGIIFLTPFFSVIVTSIIIAYTFSPVQAWFEKRTKKKRTATAGTLLTAVLALFIPLLLIISVTTVQARTFIADIREVLPNDLSSSNPSTFVTDTSNFINTVSGGTLSISEVQLQEYLSTGATQFASGAIQIVTGWIGSVPAMIGALVLFFYIFIGVLTRQKELIVFLKRLNPLGDDVADLYLKRAGAMTNGMVRGQFVIALVQGLLGALTFFIAGVPYIAFAFLLLTFLSIIPLGSGILAFPVGIILLLTGNVWQGLVVLLGHLLLVGNVDNLLRPVLIPKEARLPAALTLLGVFAGLAAFGFLGVIIGPIIIILVLTTLEVFAAVKQGVPLSTLQISKTKS